MWPFSNQAEKKKSGTEPRIGQVSFEPDRAERRSNAQKNTRSTLQRADFSRMSKDAVLARLEAKIGQHNFMQDDDANDEEGVANCRKSSVTSRRFKSFMQPRRLSERPIAIVRASEDDILKLREGLDEADKGTEQLTAIPVLPADEMDTLASEIQLWYKTRRTLKFVFSCALLCGLIVLAISIFFATYWYLESPGPSSIMPRNGSTYYNIHMCGQMANMPLMVVGMLVFRLLPNSSLTRVLLIHGFTFVTSFSVCTMSVYYATTYHKTFTGNDLHFYSIHSWIGVIVVSLYLVSMISGLLVLFRPTDGIRRLHPPVSILTFMVCGACNISGIFIRALIQMGWNFKLIFRDVVVFRSLEALEEPFLDIYDQYESLEDWVDDVNQARLRALRVPHAVTKGH
ncbi:unnamed protein product [Orchesella dallaii]|uniref:Cytochrome b561 domain-containing protein n=1 Tax=Orchesella dallaii TaxID=48710 RepID=A0ABP1QXV2_9HEXA